MEKQNQSLSDTIERFVRDEVIPQMLQGEYIVKRVRISGGATLEPVVDLRLVPLTVENMHLNFRDTGVAGADRLIMLIKDYMEAAMDADEAFEGSAVELYNCMTGDESPLPPELRRIVPACNWIGKYLSQIAAVGSKHIECEMRRTHGANIWWIALIGKEEG